MMRHSVIHITARQRRCGKVMFWVVCANYQSVCPQGEGSHLTITLKMVGGGGGVMHLDLTVQPHSPCTGPAPIQCPASTLLCRYALLHASHILIQWPLHVPYVPFCALYASFHAHSVALPHHSITLPCRAPSAKKEESWNFAHDHYIDYTCWRWPFTVMIKKHQLFVNFDCKWMHI